jgi:hypothetical protein
MKTLYRLFYRLTIKDYLKVMESARMTSKMINESTYGKMTHFYDSSGKQIRGFHKHITIQLT